MPSDDEILRIAAQFDVGSITAGMDEAAASVKAGTAKMNDSFSNLANAQIRVSSANKELRDTLNATVSGGLSPTVNATEEVAAAMFEAKIATDAFKAAQQEAYGATERLSGGVNNSRIAFTGLTQDLGLRGSRALGSFIAQSSTLGPLLQAAFPIVAAVAFFEILEAGYQKIIDVTSALAGWTKEAKQMEATLVSLNQKQLEFNEKLAIEKLALSEVGLKGSALDHEKELNYGRERLLLQKDYIESRNKELSIKKEMEGTTEHIPSISTPYGLSPEMDIKHVPDKDRLEQLNKELTEAMARTQELGNQLSTLDQVTVPKGIAEERAAAAAEAVKADKDAEREYEKFAKMQMDEEEEVLNRARKAFEERERLEEELAKTTLDLAKKDLDSFRTDIVEKVRLQEQFGRDQIEQIRAASEAQSKNLESRSFAGAADPGLIAIADKALDEQAFKIMDLIALEEKLRATLVQTGMAESDPKIQESLSRQQQLVQQLAVAMQRYDKVVQDATNRQNTQFKQSFDQITSTFNRSILSWMDGTEKFGKAMEKVWLSLANTAVMSLLKIGEQELVGLLLHKTIADEQKLDDAKTAAAGAYAATAGVPIVGPVLAPAAAAAAFAAVLAFEKGGIMPNREGLALLHPREMVLDSNISESVQKMASGGGGRSAGHIRVNNTQHIYGNPSPNDLAKMEQSTTNAVRRASRRGGWGN